MRAYAKTRQIAEYLIAKGVPMTGEQMFEAGFRFEDGSETTAKKVRYALSNLAASSMYDTECSYVQEGKARRMYVRVKSITPYHERVAAEPGANERELWRQLLTKKSYEVRV